MSGAAEEARRRARHIRDEALARHAERDMASLAALRAELAEVKAMLAGQHDQLARLIDMMAELTARPVQHDLTAIPSSTPRPLSRRKRLALARIRELRHQDHSFARITEIFRAEGVPTLSGQGQWSKGTLWNLWKNHAHQLSEF